MIKILQVINSLQIGGAEIVVESLAKNLDRKSFRVEILVLGQSSGSNIEKRLETSGIKISYMNLKLDKYNFQVKRKIDIFLKNNYYDIINTHLSGLNYLYFSTLRDRKTIIIHTFHSRFKQLGVKSQIFQFLFARNIRKIAVSSCVAKSLRVLRDKRIAVINNGVDEKKFSKIFGLRTEERKKLGIKNGEIVFVNVANLKPVKNQQVLIEAFAKLVKSLPSAKLLIVGDGPERGKLQKQIVNWKLENKVRLMGLQNNVEEILATSDIYISTSKSEGFSLSLVEAMLAKLPVISTKVGIAPEVIKVNTNGFLINSNANNIAVVMKKLASNSKLRRKFGKAGSDLAKEHFALTRMLKSYEDLYYLLVDERKKSFREIPLFKIYSDKKDLSNISSIIKSKMYWAVGKETEKFEKNISQFIGSDYALTFNSGTSAIYSALLAAGIGNGDEVIVPAFTYIATVEPVSLVGAKPVFADIEEATFGLAPRDVEKKINKKTKAIIAVHYAGIPCQISALAKIAKKRKILLIEDAAEAFGSTIEKRKVGGFGDMAIFSFSQGKVITTGEGGVVVTNSKTFYDQLKLIRSLGRSDNSNGASSKDSVDFISPGYNFRLANILSALGISQLSRIDEIIEKRMELANYYQKKLKKISGIEIVQCPNSNLCGYQTYPILAEDRDGLQEYLSKFNIASKVYFPPVYNYSIYKNASKKLVVTEKISAKILSIPFYTAMKKKNIDYVVVAIRDFYRKNSQDL